jgi:dipeptidase D
MDISQLSPIGLWKNFAALNAVPRPSKKEERVIQFMKEFGQQLSLPTFVDKVGNVIIKKPATQGMEDRQTVILQSHLDMVHQKNNDTVFDFDKQGIEMYVDGDWVKANGTTLGADNGIGVATIMAILESKDIAHPAIEAMFTIDEETGMTGAKELDPSYYEGTILLNLDTEDDDELSIGCAGGIDTNTSYNYQEIASPRDLVAIEIQIKGLMGGHSGMDIHKGRGNANKLMNRILYDAPVKIYVHTIEGGGLRNAIPRESVAIVSIHEEDEKVLKSYLSEKIDELKAELKPVEPNLNMFIFNTAVPAKCMAIDDQEKMLRTIYALHNGVFKMSLTFDNLVETSSSLAQVTVKDGQFETKSLQRSSVESTKKDVANSIRAAFELMGANVEQSGDYPGWEPNPDSPILKLLVEKYKAMFNEEPRVLAGHAGLECGILGEHLPNVDMISFGPNIRHAHSPDECVQISSVEKFWKFFLSVLADIPKK